MSTYTQDFRHIIFATKHRRPTLDVERRREFLACSFGTIKGLKCHLYCINCVEDHLHMLVGLHATVALASFVKEFNESTNKWIKSN